MKKTTILCTVNSREKGIDFKMIPAYFKVYSAANGKQVKLCFHHPDFENEKLTFINPLRSKTWRCSEYFSGLIATPFSDTYRLKDLVERIDPYIIDTIAKQMQTDYVKNIIKTKLENGYLTDEEVKEFEVLK